MGRGIALRLIKLRLDTLTKQEITENQPHEHLLLRGAQTIVHWLQTLQVLLVKENRSLPFIIMTILGFVKNPTMKPNDLTTVPPAIVFLADGNNQRLVNRAVWDMILEHNNLLTLFQGMYVQETKNQCEAHFVSDEHAKEVFENLICERPNPGWIITFEV